MGTRQSLAHLTPEERAERRKAMNRANTQRYIHRHPERIKAQKQRYSATPEGRAKINAYALALYHRTKQLKGHRAVLTHLSPEEREAYKKAQDRARRQQQRATPEGRAAHNAQRRADYHRTKQLKGTHDHLALLTPKERIAQKKAVQKAYYERTKRLKGTYDFLALMTPEERDARRKAMATEKAQRWRTQHTERARANARAWSAANPELAHAKHARRRAVEKGAPRNDLTAAQWQEIKDAFDHRCAYCGRKMQRLEQDHITPLSKGGSHTFTNIVPACKSCNSRKQAGSPLKPVQPLLLTVAASRKKKS